jgi:hypothetical protein
MAYWNPVQVKTVALVRIDVSEEHIASISQELHGVVISQKTASILHCYRREDIKSYIGCVWLVTDLEISFSYC